MLCTKSLGNAVHRGVAIDESSEDDSGGRFVEAAFNCASTVAVYRQQDSRDSMLPTQSLLKFLYRSLLRPATLFTGGIFAIF